MLVYSILFILISIAVNNRRDTSIIYTRLSIIAIIYSLIIININFNLNYLNIGTILFNGLIHLENYSMVFIYFILILSILILCITAFFPRKYNKNLINNTEVYNNTIIFREYSKFNLLSKLILNKKLEQFRIIEYPLIILFCITGAIFLISSSDIVSIFLSIELQSYSLYLISAIYRNSEYSVGASLTYFLLGGLSSCIILLGISLLYINIGNTNLENIYIINNISTTYSNNFINDEIVNNIYIYKYIFIQYIYIQIALVIMSIGFLFKISAAPFHF
jgi:NADH-ubiquinone oxidoreductase chain 2